MSETQSMFGLLRQSADPPVADAIERLVGDAPDRKLVRINTLAFAAENELDEERAIAAFLHAAKIGIFEMSWNVLCPGCGGVLDSSTTLKTVRSDAYACSLCATDYEPTLDEMVEVTFTISPRVRQIAAHSPEALTPMEYYRQLYFSSELALPEDFEALWEKITLESVDLPAGEKAIISLQLPEKFIIVFDPITHTAQFLDVKGDPTKERQPFSLIFETSRSQHATVTMRPGPLRLSVENRTDRRLLPTVFIADHDLHEMMHRRRPFLTAKRLLSNQTFRDVYRTDTLDVDQRLKITSLTFLFTDLRGSTELYERVGDLAAFDLVRAHFQVLHEIVASEAGAVVKTIGDAVMATFPTPDRAVAAALRMREAMRQLNADRGREDLLLKIGIHEGPCIAVTLNERQDYFGQTVNIASRVQHLATSREIFATGAVVENERASGVLTAKGLTPTPHNATLRGIANEVSVYAIP
ncbi:MAG: adenylate/guanylate cyclase domain-containing protein [Propylenella sp.]